MLYFRVSKVLPEGMTMRSANLSVLATVATLAFQAPVQAESTCSAWMDQGNGTSWAICVDDAGNRHCYLINNTPGSTAYEVSCSA